MAEFVLDFLRDVVGDIFCVDTETRPKRNFKGERRM